MADNLAITVGAGTTIATDDIGGVHHQRVKLSLGADGSAVDAVAGAGAVSTAVQRVTLASDDPAVTLLTSLTPKTATWTPAAAAYVAGDVAGTTAPQTFTGVGASGKQVMIIGATLSIATTTPTATAWRLHIFNATPTAIADNAPFVLASGDIAKYLGFIDLGTPVDLTSTAQWSEQNGMAKPVLLVDTTIVAYLEVRSSVTLENVAHLVTLFTVPLS
jgi:hypothetical protein